MILKAFPKKLFRGNSGSIFVLQNKMKAFGDHINMLLECPPMLLKAFPRKLFRGNSVMHITKLFHVIL